MICPACGSSRIYPLKSRITTMSVLDHYCPDCMHYFDREDVKDANENREADDE